MDFEAVLSTVTYIAFLVLLPAAAALTYFILLLHQAIRNQERFGELKKRKGRRSERLRRTAEAKRLADPFFHFNINASKTVDEMVADQLARERGEITPRTSEREAKIAKAIEDGRLILLDTAVERCTPGMILGKAIPDAKLYRGDEITPERLAILRGLGLASVPVLYNPGRVAGAMAGASA